MKKKKKLIPCRYQSLDEYGLVSSSLSYLQSLEFHQLKKYLSLEMITSQAYLYVLGNSVYLQGPLTFAVGTAMFDHTSSRDARYPRTWFYATVTSSAILAWSTNLVEIMMIIMTFAFERTRFVHRSRLWFSL